MTSHDGPDALQLLQADHRTVDLLFSRLEAASGDDLADLAGEIVRELSVHAAIEEQVLYPALREALPDGDQLADHGIEEHQEMKELLASVDGKSPEDADVRQTFTRLKKALSEHVEEEEQKIFLKLRAAVDADRLAKMGSAIEKARAVAPTRPHPNAPSTPPGNLIAGPAAALLDKVRDAARSVFSK